MENELVSGSQNYCWLVGDQIPYLMQKYDTNIYKMYVILFWIFFCDILSHNVKMYL